MDVIAQSESNYEWAGVHECGLEGTYEYKIISGVSPYDYESEVNASKLVYDAIYKGCIDREGDIKRTGTRKRVWDWKRNYANRTWVNDWSGSTENFVYELDETHRFTITSATWSGKTSQKKKEDTWETISEIYTSHYVRSGKLVDGDTTLEFKNIIRDKTEIEDMWEGTYSRKWELSAAIKSDDWSGCIIVDTPEALEKNQNDLIGDTRISCNHKGKLTISGADHVVTTEAHNDHSIDVKYDDEIIAEYGNCIEYYNDNKN